MWLFTPIVRQPAPGNRFFDVFRLKFVTPDSIRGPACLRNSLSAAFGIERVDLGVIGRNLEPVRVEMRTDEAELAATVFHRVLMGQGAGGR